MSFDQTSIKPIKVLIGIQARSNSSRFPNKIYQTIGKKTVLQHVIDKAQSAKTHLEKPGHKIDLNCDVAILHPKNDDQLVQAFKNSSLLRKTGALLITSEGEENDVLSRYVRATEEFGADYIVRITSDCPLIPDFIISKHVNTAIFNREIDYVSNVEESCRQIADGYDCEVLSRRAILWLRDNATGPDEREHVSIAIRRRRPRELRQAFIASKIDTSHMKMSIDTPEDLERVRTYYHELEAKMNEGYRLFSRKDLYTV